MTAEIIDLNDHFKPKVKPAQPFTVVPQEPLSEQDLEYMIELVQSHPREFGCD